MTPKRTNYFRLFIILAVYLGLFGFLMRKNREMPVILISLVVMFVMIFGALSSRRIVAFVVAHPKATRAAGVAWIVLAVLLLVGGILAFPQLMPDDMLLMGTFLVVLMIGVLLLTLPRSAQYQAKAFSGELKPAVKSATGFDGPREALASIGFVLQRWPAFIAIAGVWTILYATVPLAAAQYEAQRSGLIAHIYDLIPAKANADIALAAVFAWIIVDLIATPIVAAAWHRYVFDGRLPRWGMALPSRGTLRYLFILWIFSATVGTFDKLIASNGQDLSMLIGVQLAKPIIEITQDLIALLAIWMFGPFALVLPSSVLKRQRMDLHTAIRAAYTLGRSYPVGLLFAILPGLAAGFALVRLVNYALPESISTQQSSMIVPSVFYFIAVASGATYLSRAYLAATKDTPGIGSATVTSPIVTN